MALTLEQQILIEKWQEAQRQEALAAQAAQQQAAQGSPIPVPLVSAGIKELLSGGEVTSAASSNPGGMLGLDAIAAKSGVAEPTIMGNLGGMAGTLGGAGALAGILGGTALVGKGVKDLYNKKTTKGWEGWGGRASLGIATGGLSEVARLAGFGRKSTADYDRERKQKVISRGNKGWEDYYSREGQAPDKMAIPAEIKRAADGSWVKEDGSWDPREYAGVQGNADTFGDDWFKLNEDQRNTLVTQFKDAGLYHKNKGDVLIADRNQPKAREMFNAIFNTPSTNTGNGLKPLVQALASGAPATPVARIPSNWTPSSIGARTMVNYPGAASNIAAMASKSPTLSAVAKALAEPAKDSKKTWLGIGSKK